MVSILHIKLKRDETGITLFLQSGMNWDFVRKPQASDVTIAGIACRPLKPEAEFRIDGMPSFIMQTQEPKLFVGEAINLSFLGAKEIANGVTFQIPRAHPISAAKMKKFHDGLSLVTKEIFRQFMKPVNLEVRLYTEEVVR